MKRIILLIGWLSCNVLCVAQRYTGWGRGLDWGHGYTSGLIDYLFLLLILILIVIAAIYVGVTTLFSKIKNPFFPIEEGLISFSDFERKYEYYRIGTVINNEDGDCYDICVLTRNNNNFYIGISTYLGHLSNYEILKRKKHLYIRWTNGAYTLCSVESEKRRLNDNDSHKDYHTEEIMQHMIYNLNWDVNYELKRYTVTIIG